MLYSVVRHFLIILLLLPSIQFAAETVSQLPATGSAWGTFKENAYQKYRTFMTDINDPRNQ